VKKKECEIAWDQPFRDAFVSPLQGDPYEILAEFGVSFDSSMKELHDCALQAQKQRALTSARDQSFRRLLNEEKRLVLDLLYFQPQPSIFDLSEPNMPHPHPDGSASNIGKQDSSEPGTVLWSLLREAWDPPCEDLPALPLPLPLLEEE
jgi:hypothetical protein